MEIMSTTGFRAAQSLIGQISKVPLEGSPGDCTPMFDNIRLEFVFPCGLRIGEEIGILRGSFSHLFYAHERHHTPGHRKGEWLLLETVETGVTPDGAHYSKVTARCDCPPLVATPPGK